MDCIINNRFYIQKLQFHAQPITNYVETVRRKTYYDTQLILTTTTTKTTQNNTTTAIMPQKININNNKQQRRHPGRGGRGRGGRQGPPSPRNPTTNNTRKAGWSKFLQNQEININSTTNNKRGNDQRSPFEGDSIRKKAPNTANSPSTAPLSQLITHAPKDDRTARATPNPTPTQQKNNKNFHFNETNSPTSINIKHNEQPTNLHNTKNNKSTITNTTSNDLDTNTSFKLDQTNNNNTHSHQNKEMEELIKTMDITWSTNEIKEMKELNMTETDYYLFQQEEFQSNDKDKLNSSDKGKATTSTPTATNDSISQDSSATPSSVDHLFEEDKAININDTYDTNPGKVTWTEDDYTEMEALEMTEEEYAAYRNMYRDEDSVDTLSATEIEKREQEAEDQWYDDEINDNEVEILEKDTEEARVKEMFLPRVKQEKDSQSSSPSQEATIDPPTSHQDNSKDSLMTSPIKDSPEDPTESTIKTSDSIQTPKTSETGKSTTTATPAPNTSSGNNHKIPIHQSLQSSPTLLKYKSQSSQSSLTPTEKMSNYKSVNPTSINRTVTSSRNRDKTPDTKNKRKVQHKYATRVTLKLNIEPSDDPLGQVIDVMKEFLRESSQIDETISIVPWRNICHLDPITHNSIVPNTVTGMHKFMHKLYVPKKGEQTSIYPHIKIAHDTLFSDLRDDLLPWLTSQGHGMFYNMLQADDGTEIGWLLYSTREMDAGALADEIIDAIDVNIGLRWKVINSGKKNMSKDNMVRALSVEVSGRSKTRGIAQLLKLYSRKMKPVQDYPNGIRLRFVKSRSSGVNSIEKSKMDKLRVRQKEFLKCIRTSVTEEIISLDYSPDAGNVPTLRQMIMDIVSPTTNAPLFHSVDRDWRLEGFKLQFSPALEEEAETAIHTLLPLLKHLFPNVAVEDHFEADTARRCEYMVWNEEKKMIIDTLVPDETEHITEDEDLVGFTFNINHNKTLLARPERKDKEKISAPIPSFPPHDDDSVSTLHPSDRTTLTSATNQPISQSHHSSQTPSQHRHSTASSVTSQSTNISMASFVQLESKVAGLASQILVHQNRHAHQFDTIMQALNTLQPQPNSTQTNPSSTNSNSVGSTLQNNTSGQGL